MKILSYLACRAEIAIPNSEILINVVGSRMLLSVIALAKKSNSVNSLGILYYT